MKSCSRAFQPNRSHRHNHTASPSPSPSPNSTIYGETRAGIVIATNNHVRVVNIINKLVSLMSSSRPLPHKVLHPFPSSSLTYTMTTTRQPQIILERLDKLLNDTPKHSASFAEDLSNNAEYVQGQEYYLKTTPRTVIEVNHLAERAARMINSGDFSGKAFRICDVGCGGGVWDRQLLECLVADFPHVEFDYLGADINEAACQKARRELGSLPQQVSWSVECCDFEKLANASFKDEKFDLVITVHTLYYTDTTSLPGVISNLLSLVGRNGKLVIINCRRCTSNEILHRMWLHENNAPLMYLSDISQVLSKMDLQYNCEKLNFFSDLTKFFKDEFKSPLSKAVLDFLSHANLSRYPPEVSDTCVEFLREVCTGQPENFLMPVKQDAIFVAPATI